MANAVKTISGVAQADIGKLNGLAIASVGKIGGVTNEVTVTYGWADMTVMNGTTTETNGTITNGSGSAVYSNGTFDDCYFKFTVTESVQGMTFHLNDANQSPFESEVIFWLKASTVQIYNGWANQVALANITYTTNDVIKFTVVGTTATVYKNDVEVTSGTVTNNSAGYIGFRNSEASTITIKNIEFGQL